MFLIELKAVTQVQNVHFAQAINYLEVQHFKVGLVIRFRQRSLGFKRLRNK